HAGAAFDAASMARLASARPPCASVPMTAPVAGFLASKVAPDGAASQRPSRYRVLRVSPGRAASASAPAAATVLEMEALGGTGGSCTEPMGLLHPRRPECSGART